MTTTAKPPFRASRYTTGAILLHWSIALLIIFNLALGFIMVAGPDAANFISRTGVVIALKKWLALPDYGAYQFHKSIGIMVLVLTVARIAWRLFNPPPPEPASVSAPERRVSGLVHVLFYVLMLAIPLSGWVMVSVSSITVPTELFFQEWLPWPHLPLVGGLPEAVRATLEERSIDAHAILAVAMTGLIGLHVAGALKHHIADGHFIARMLPGGSGDGPRRAYGQATAVIVALIFAGGMIASATYARQGAPTEVADPAPSAAPAAATPAEAGADVGRDVAAWTPRADESRLGFVAVLNGSEAPGTFASWSADIRFDPDNLASSSIDVAIDTASASIESSDVSQSQLTGSDGFDADAHATARFTADTITAADDGKFYIAAGTLTLRGTSVPVTLPFTVDIAGDVATASGEVTLNRHDFGIGEGAGAMLADDVAVTIEIVADRGAAATATPPAAAAAQASAWTVLEDESALTFTFPFEGVDLTGTFPVFDAAITFSPDDLENSSIATSVDLASATVSGPGVSESQLKGADGLAASEESTARFEADTITATESGYAAEGTLTLRGQTVPVTLDFAVSIEGDTATASASTTLERLDFGIGERNDPTGDSLGKTVTVSADLVATRSGGERAASR